MLVSKIIYKISYVMFLVALTFSLFVIIGSVLSFLESSYAIDVPLIEITQDDGNSFSKMEIPFLDLFIKFELSIIIVFMWLFFTFYAIYFYSLSQFFNVFTKERVFTNSAIKKLELFMKLNVIPILFGVAAIFVEKVRNGSFKMDSEYLLIFVHLFVVLLIYFYVDLVKKGKLLQEENDLMI